MTAVVPIPTKLWQKMLGFLQSGSTGQVLLDIKDGQVQSCRLTEFVRAERNDSACTLDEKR